MASKELIGKLGLDTTAFDKSLSESLGKLKSFGSEMTKTGKKLSTAVTLPILAIGTASVMAASDAEETASKFNTIFRDISGDAERSFSILRNEYGLSSTAARQLLGDTGDLLTGFGFSQSAALELSEEVNKLAVDLASFTNFSGGAKGASAALTKALLGERESVKALGISILEEDVKKQMAINTAKGLVFETERQAKAQATLDIAISQSQNAIGDYARTSDSFANQLRLLQARTHDLMVEFGEILLPVVSKLLGAVQGVVNWFTQLDGTTKKIIVIVGGLAAAIGPVLVGLGFLASTILPAMIAGFAALFSPVTLVIAAVAALAAAALYVADNWDVLKERISNFGVIFKNAIIDLVQFLLKNNPIQLLIKPYEYLLGLLGVELPNPFEMISDSLDQFRGEVKENTKQFGSFGQAVKNAFTGAKKDIESVDKAEKNLIKTTENLTTTVQGLGFSFKETFGNLASEMEIANAISIHSPFKNLNEDLKELNPKLLTADQLMQGNTAAMNAMSEETLEFATAWQALELNEQNALLNDMFSIINAATGAFQTLFSTMLNGGNVLQAVGNMIKQLVAKMLAMAAIAGILALMSGGTSALAGGIKSAFGGSFKEILFKLLGFESFAEGGMVTGQTMAMVGDNPSGKEAIIPFEKMGSFINMATGGMGAKSVHVEVTGRVTGEDIILAGNNFTNSKTRRLGF
jgi:CII-binding regulator of phage lambda lysogenization HflD